jgi:hypothetical protein
VDCFYRQLSREIWAKAAEATDPDTKAAFEQHAER